MGGGTAYLALLALLDLPYKEIPSITLLLNIVVASISFYQYQKAGYLRSIILIPFMISSIPASLLGGLFSLTERFYFSLLSIVLFLVALRMLFFHSLTKVKQTFAQDKIWILGLLSGAVIGMLSGMVGIGGGIFLGPLLLLTGWATPRGAACASSCFIVVNSVVGFFAHSIKGEVNLNILLPLGICVILGSFIGSFLGARKLPPAILQRIFATIILIVAIKIVLTNM